MGQLSNLATRGASVFSNRNTKLCFYRAGMHIEEWKLVKMNILEFWLFPGGQLPNFATRGTSLFTNRTTKRGIERALVNLRGCIIVEMHIFGYHLKALGIDQAFSRA